MRVTLLIISLLLCFTGLYSKSQADEILGVYYTRNKDSKVEIFKRGEKYYGKIVWLKDSIDENGKPLRDVNNPNEDLRSQRLLGLVFMKDFVYKEGSWLGGKLYTPKYGVHVDGHFRLLPSGDAEMKASYFFIYRTERWERVELEKR